RSCRVGTAPPQPAGLLRECPRSPPRAEASSLSSLRRPAGSDGARLRTVGCRTWCRFWGTGRNFGRDLANDELHQREGGGLRADRPRSCDAKKMLQRAMRHALKTFTVRSSRFPDRKSVV